MCLEKPELGQAAEWRIIQFDRSGQPRSALPDQGTTERRPAGYKVLKHLGEKPWPSVRAMRRLMVPAIAHRNRASRHGLKNGEELSFSQSWMSKASGLEQTHYGDMEARRKQVLAADERRSTLIQKQFVTCHPVQISAHLRSSAANRSSPWPPCLRGGI